MEYKDLLKAAKQYKASENDFRVALLGDNATQFLAQAIRGLGVLSHFQMQVFDADYDQIYLQAFDDNSELYKFKPHAIIIFMCWQKLYEKYHRIDAGNAALFATNMAEEIQRVHNWIHDRCDASLLQFTFPTENDMVFGNYGLKVVQSYVFQVNKLNLLLMEEAAVTPYLKLIDINAIRSQLSEEEFYDPKVYCNAKLAVSMRAVPMLAKGVLDVLKPIKGDMKKCIIFDLDNTIWGGTIGDDGLENIELGELGIGYAYSELQCWLKELKKRGIILCVCSKNNENIAKEPFLNHPDMILHMEDIAMFVANWEDKASNIRYIQRTLNIGMDSIVFLDDNPFERNLVRTIIPEITVPELPSDPALYCTYLRSLNLFETSVWSQNDEMRTEQYRAEANRRKLQEDYTNYDEYLNRLEMRGTVKTFEKYFYPRIAQLTQRSNQFNLRTVRYTEAEIEKIANDKRYLTFQFTLEDRFGDHGLVGVVILEDRGECAFVDTWLMSCRVLKRGMEEYIVNAVMEAAADAGFAYVEGEYIPTSKNVMVCDIYEKFGFTSISENKYLIRTNEYVRKDTYIKNK